MRRTVEYVVQTALEGGEGATVRLVYVHGGTFDEESPDTDAQQADALLERAAGWATDAADRELTVETAHLGGDRYVFSPTDIAATVAADAHAQDIKRVVVDPEYDPGIGSPLLRSIAAELDLCLQVPVEEAPVSRSTRRLQLLERTSVGQIGALFLVAFGFYQVLGGNFAWVTAGLGAIDWFDVVTGTVAAAVTAVGLSQVSFTRSPDRATPGRLLRQVVYIPYLLVEILRSNVIVAGVILHPQLPIEPRLVKLRPALWGGLPMTVYANSVTLTPGTLSVRIDGRRLLVHTLLPQTREGLLDGGLERAVRFVFYGREAMGTPSPRERGEAELVATERVTGSAGAGASQSSPEADTDSPDDQEVGG